MGTTPLWWAAYKSYFPIVKLLVKADSSLDLANYNDETPLHHAAHKEKEYPYFSSHSMKSNPDGLVKIIEFLEEKERTLNLN